MASVDDNADKGGVVIVRVPLEKFGSVRVSYVAASQHAMLLILAGETDWLHKNASHGRHNIMQNSKSITRCGQCVCLGPYRFQEYYKCRSVMIVWQVER